MNSADNNAQFRGGAPSESSQPIRFAGSVLGAQRHVCAFFHSPDEEYRVLLPFIKEGFESVLEGGRQQGFALTRLVAHMEWALEDRPGVDDLVEYETRLNFILPRYKDPVI